MKRNNFRNFNPRSCEEQLSPFGQQVLRTLINKWNEDGDCKKKEALRVPQHRHQRYHNNRVISFEEHTPTIERTFHPQLSFGDVSDEGPPIMCLPLHSPPHPSPDLVATSSDLLRSATETDRTVVLPATPQRADLITTFNIDVIDKSQNFNSPMDKEIAMSTKEVQNDGLHDKHRNVNWDDMFDTELFSNDVGEVTPNNEKDIMHEVDTNLRPENILQSVPEVFKTIKDDSKEKQQKPETGNKKKRKNPAKVKETAPKKTKKSDSIPVKLKVNTRKQSSKKAVANWLQDINPNNPVEGSVQENVEANAVQKMEIVIEKTLENASKKVIQTRLANKDGVMKFKKPTQNSNGESIAVIKSTESLESQTKETAKEKKGKSKFMAPIKAQLPVKDITYDIREVDVNNVTQLNNVVNEEVTAILIYSNGFNQLNSQYTAAEGDLAPVGLLLQYHEIFYYVANTQDSLRDFLSQIIKNNRVVCYDGKAMLIYLMAEYNLEFDTTLHIMDIKTAAGIIWADSDTNRFSAIQTLSSTAPSYTIATNCIRQKAAWYSSQLTTCARALNTLLNENSLEKLYTEIEMPLLPIIAGMEHRGVLVDGTRLHDLETTLSARLRDLERQCHSVAGRPVQLTSAPQLRALLYEELQLDTRANLNVRGTDVAGAKSTAEDMLRRVSGSHELPSLVVRYRRLRGVRASLLGLASHCTGGVVRPRWQQLAAATGRMGCSAPNLQALPKAPIDLDEDTTSKVSARSVVVARPGLCLLAADFQQVECRVWAHLAADHKLRDALSAPDLFRELAARWLDCDASMVSSEDRERTKRMVYATLYGAGVRKLMDILQVDYERAVAVSDSFYTQFPSLKSFGSKVVSQCRESNGHVSATSGRRRYLPGALGDCSGAGRMHAERQAVNFVVQGCAADVCKLAMSNAVRELRARKLQATLLLQLHDELVWEVPLEELADTAAVLVEAMERSGESLGLCQLPVALASGLVWGDLRPYTLSTTN